MKRIFLFIMLSSLFWGCEEFEGVPFERFTIKEGTHSAVHKVDLLFRRHLVYDIVFDESAIYETENPSNQADVNKLIGFADCNNFHHDNSARFGWRYDPDVGKVEILAYCYSGSKRIIKEMAHVDFNKPYTYIIGFNDANYQLAIYDNDSKTLATEIVERNNTCDKGEYYMLWPYFGGDETAPHEINIYMKRYYYYTWKKNRKIK